MSVWLQNLSWEEAKAALQTAQGVAILPVGSTEQHGYHLPLGTDSMVAITLAEAAAEKAGVVVTPPVWYGWSPHHMALPGTITVRPEILTELVYDILHSLWQHGWQKVIALNGHRIVNLAWLQLAAERAQRELGLRVVLADPAYLAKEIVRELDFGPVGHAEEIETSHMLYRYPELVHLEKAVDNPVEAQELYSVDPGYSKDTLAYVPSTKEHMQLSVSKAGGTTGCPSKAEKEKGKIYHDHLVTNLVKIIKKLQEN